MATASRPEPVVGSPGSEGVSLVRSPRRAAVAGGVGTLIEGYDFSMYGYLAVVIGPAFFPSHSDSAALLAALLAFAAAYVVRPLGGLVFGHLGDRISRRTALIITLMSMGLASTLIGVLPTYRQVGLLAPIVLVALRLVQGFSVGGEVAGATTFVSEATPRDRQGRYGALNPFGANLGFGLASAVAGTVSLLTTDEQMASWGWRIPFLLALPLTVCCYLLRRRFARGEPPAERPEHAPLWTVFRRHPRALVEATGVSIATNGTAYFGLVYLGIHLTKRVGLSDTSVYWLTTCVVVVSAALMLCTGRLGDRIGLPWLAVIGLTGYLALTYGAMSLMGHGGLWVAGAAFLLIMVNTSFLQVAGYSLLPQMFDRDVRYTGVAIGWNVGVVVAGGTAPVVSAWLAEETGNALSPAYFVMSVALIGLLAVGAHLAHRRRAPVVEGE